MFASTLPSEEELDGVKLKVCSRHTTRRCIIYRCLNVLQHKQVKERFARLLTEDADTLISDNLVEEQMQMEELMRYVRDNLSLMEQNVFRLHYLKEMTCQEVAGALNVSRQTVHTLLKQSVGKIRKYFNSNSKAI